MSTAAILVFTERKCKESEARDSSFDNLDHVAWWKAVAAFWVLLALAFAAGVGVPMLLEWIVA